VPAYYVNVFEELADFDTWFISEQGQWGIPVPYFYHTKT
jgi:isoleucyl-tRNA synthetase